ncbi:MAG: hypothetical protein EKK40_03070 [Bradyrhizobiaceae bacterium]|nr:MAG: hypothetical protein EKK40_03070 [Bradyrhizobiaceae bacterium]
MKQAIVLAAIGAATLITATAARAAPIQPSVPSVSSEASDIVQVRGFCGLGRHRGPWGGCLPNGVGYAYRPYAYGPYYAYAGPYGRCWWRAGAYGPVRVCAW